MPYIKLHQKEVINHLTKDLCLNLFSIVLLSLYTCSTWCMADNDFLGMEISKSACHARTDHSIDYKNIDSPVKCFDSEQDD